MRIFKETNQGQNQEHVRFIADNGYFEGGGSQIDKFTETTFFIDSTYDGMAVVNYIFPSSPSSTGIKTIKIEAIKNNITWVNKKIFARCFVDAETSKLRPPNCHETTDSVSKTKEIKGDGYPDVPFFDTLKSIKVEIDYAGSYISHSTVQSALQYCKEILSTAKLDTSNVNFSIDENISTMEAWLIPQKIKEYLAQYRTHRDCIHLILGSKTSPGQIYKYLGVTILYFVPDANFTFARFANFASGKDSIKAQCILDSTGIFVCVSRIDSIVNDSVHYTWSIPNMTGYVMAHELGHTLGVDDEIDLQVKNVMKKETPYLDNRNLYAFFDTLRLNRNPPRNAMNTRDVLGIHTVTIYR